MRTIAPAAFVLARSTRNNLPKRPHRPKPPRSHHDLLWPERLEDRLLMASDLLDGTNASGLLSSQAGVCNCPICTGQGLDGIPLPAQIDINGTLAQAPLTSLPQLHSNASATAKLFLDFDGHFEASWGGRSNVTTPVFDLDADPTTFSAGELAAINEIWSRVAEDYAPFNIDVTTVDPGNQTNRVTAVMAIGGSYSDWYGSAAGGVAYVGGFSNLSPNVGYIFATSLSGNTKYIAEATSHEAGHLFGLQHQASWNGSTLTTEYNSGNSAWAPLMGTAYYATRSTWYNGPTSAGPTSTQDDMAIIAGTSNGFGYKTDDYGGTIAIAGTLPTSGTSVNFSGLIGQANDVDMWSFMTTGGAVTFQLTGAQYGTNLDGILEIRDSAGNTIAIDNPSNSLGASLATTLSAGTYYLVARGVGDYGDAGQYTITGSLPVATTTMPEIDVAVDGVSIADGGSINFGSTNLGTAVTKTFTVTNQGSGVLTLTSLNAGSMPSGYTLVSNLGATSLNPGASTTFVICLNATAAGSPSGAIQLFSNDSDEGTYDLTLSGTVIAPEIAIAISGTDVADGQTVNFGSTTLGQSVSRTFTVTNTGNATLTLTSLNAGSLPAGFTLTSNLGSTSLAAGQSTTFTICLDAAAAGSFSGSIQLLNNDSDENPYDITLTGSVGAPEINLALGGASLTVGQAIDFGSTPAGSPVTRTFTVTNVGTSDLHLTTIDPAGLPAGFSLVSGCATNTVAAGQSTSFTIQFDAASTGTFSGSFALLSDDSNEGTFTLQLQATALTPTPPRLTALVAGQQFVAGGTLDFGTTVTASPLDRTMWIRNDGQSVLTLAALDPATLPAGYSIVQNLTQTSLAAGESTSFILRLDAQAPGSYSGQISLNSNDAAGAYTFSVTGTVVNPVPPLVQIVDNGNAGSSFVGTWQKSSGKGYASDSQTASKGAGQSVYSWNFSGLPADQYRIYATWISAGTNASNAPYSFFDGATKLANVAVNQRVAPGGLSDSGANWKLLGTVTVNSGGLTVKLSNAANGKVVADAIRIERVVPLAPTAQIDLTYNSATLTSGTSSIDFGSPDLGQPQTRTFTIVNHGTGSLTLTPIDPATLPAGFSLVENLGTTFLTPGESTTFTVRLDADAAGSFAGTIAVASDAPGDNLFRFQVAGIVYDPTAPVTRIIDDGSLGQSKSGTWTRVATAGYSGDQLTAAAGKGTSTATWSFGQLANGEYRIQASWKANATNASNAPYAFISGGQLLGATKVNQRVAPNDHWDGVWFRTIGTITVTNHQLTVKLTNAANGTVIADAIRIEKIFPGANSSLPEPAALPANPHAPTDWSNPLLASAAVAIPDAIPLPAGQNQAAATLPRTSSPDPWQQALSAVANEQEDHLLADVLDLISTGRQPQAVAFQEDTLAVHELALGALLGQLVPGPLAS